MARINNTKLISIDKRKRLRRKLPTISKKEIKDRLEKKMQKK